MPTMNGNTIICEGTATSATNEKFARICRACLSEYDLKPIFGTTIDNLEVDHLLSHLVSIKVDRDDLLPQNICSTCIEELHRIHKFRKQCHINEVVLKNLQLKSQPIELERGAESKLNISTITEENIDDLLSSSEYTGIPCNDHKHGQTMTCKIEEHYTVDDKLWPQTKDGNVLYKDDAPHKETTDIKQNGLSDMAIYSLKTESIPSDASLETFTFESDHNKSPNVFNICGKKFEQEERLLHHKKENELAKQTVGEPNTRLSCQFCGKSSKHASSCKVHKMGLRDGSRYLSKKVTYKTESSQHDKNHEMKREKQNSEEVDEEGPMYICYHCEKCFGNKEYLKKHLQCHSKRRFLCNLCGAECISGYKLRIHARIHTGERPHVCSVCKKTFTHLTTLSRHRRIHTGQKPYSCEFCGRQFTQRTHLNKHLRLHTGERPYACHLCEKVFIDNASLTIHVRLHTGDRCFVCTICGKGYYTKSTKRKHMKQVHKIEEEEVEKSSSEPSQVAALI